LDTSRRSYWSKWAGSPRGITCALSDGMRVVNFGVTVAKLLHSPSGFRHSSSKFPLLNSPWYISSSILIIGISF
jgi:hypothetical protein